MTLNTTVELFTCLFSFVCGLSAGFIYDFLSVIVYKNGKTVEILKDIFYFAVIAFVSVNVIRNVNDGIFRVYELVFLIAGVLSYSFILGNIVRKILKVLVRWVYKTIKFVLKVLVYPFVLILKPIKKVIQKKYSQISKKIVKNRLTIKQICFRIIMYMGEVKRFYKHK